jgi:hypothetical protein
VASQSTIRINYGKGTPHEFTQLEKDQERFQSKSTATMSQVERPTQCHNADDVGTCERRLTLRDITNVHRESVDPDGYMSDVSMIGLSDEDEEDNGGECATSSR